jgi:pyruvate kinase
MFLRAGAVITVGPTGDVPILQAEILAAMEPGNRLLLGDGEIEFKLTGTAGENYLALVVSGGLLKSKKGVTLVGKAFHVPALTEQDRDDIANALRLGCDFIALSYVKTAADMEELRRIVDEQDPSVGLCAKVETPEAVAEISEVVRASDLVMVARGDMGLQMDLESVPLQQKRIISQCNESGVPVITATQMLESMISNPRPTRAEANDVFNAILDGTDAVMLSGETAAGQYPIECVRTMARICEAAEDVFDRSRIERQFKEMVRQEVSPTDAIAHAVSDLCRQLKPTAILCNSTSGQTARMVSKYRPDAPILCVTRIERTQRRLAVVWGVEAMLVPARDTTDEAMALAIDQFCAQGRIAHGDLVVMTAGVPMGMAGNTNLIQLNRIGHVGVN